MNPIRLISPAVRAGPVRSNENHSREYNVVHLRRSSARTGLACVLVCRWQRQSDGRLACVWQQKPLDGTTNRHLCRVGG